MSTSNSPFGSSVGVGVSSGFSDPLGGGGGGGAFKHLGGNVNLMVLLAQQMEERLSIKSQLRSALEEQGVSITPGAYLMLLIPLYEVSLESATANVFFSDSGIELNPFGNPQQVATVVESCVKLLSEAKSDPAAFDANRELVNVPATGVAQRVLSSLSMIKAYWKKFCDIPPFCGETK